MIMLHQQQIASKKGISLHVLLLSIHMRTHNRLECQRLYALMETKEYFSFSVGSMSSSKEEDTG